MISRLFKAILKHKRITVIVLILIVIGGYFTYHNLTKSKNAVRYVTAAVEKGTVVVSSSGSGQVSVLNQVDIKPKVSGQVTSVNVTNGQEVKVGTLLVQIDASDAQKTVRDAEISLENAKIALDQANKSKEGSENDLKKTYEDGFNAIDDTFSDLPTIMAGLQNILFGDDLGSSGSWNLDTLMYYAVPYDLNSSISIESGNNVYYNSYHEAKKIYEENLNDYKSTSRSSDNKAIGSLIDETYDTNKSFSEALKNAYNLLQSYKKNPNANSITDTYISELNTYMSENNTHLTALLSIKNAIQAATGTDNSGIRSKELSLEQKENDLADAKEKLTDYSIRAPFDGVIAKIDIKKGDSISSADTIATLITNQKIAEISLNEIDAAEVKVGQKATLTFDALLDLSITGKVSEIDIIGTVSQGVVSYNVKIVLDTQNENVKPGMSVTADIITDIKQDVLVAPNNAIKSQGNSKYVELVENSGNAKQQLLSNNNSGITLPILPKQQSVETGLSDDSYTEIVSGLKEGDIVVTSTINPGQTQTSSQSQNSFRIPGVTTGGGGQGGRIPD